MTSTSRAVGALACFLGGWIGLSHGGAHAQPAEAKAETDKGKAQKREARKAQPARKTEKDSSSLSPAGQAEQMASRPADAISFKPGKGLVIKSADGDFRLDVRLRAQFLYTLEHHNDAPAGEDATLHSFEIRRARLQFGGHVFGEHNKFKAEFAFSPSDMGWEDGGPTFTPIFDWYGELDYLRDLTVRFGQYKVPFSRQRVISSGDLELVDRALAQAEFNLNRDIGLDVRSEDFLGLGHLRYYAGIFMAAGRDMRLLKTFHMNYLARVEVLPFGGAADDWDYSEADFSRKLEPRLSLGAAYSFIDNAETDQGILGVVPLDGGTTDYHNAVADVMFKYAGLSVFSEVFWREGNRNFGSATVTDAAGNEVPAPRVPSREGVGYFVQTGFLLPFIPLEVAGRFSQVFGIGDGFETSLPDAAEIGGGLSWYFAEHPYKLQADCFRIRRDSYDPFTGTFIDQVWADGIDQFRVQLQLAM